MLPARHIYVHVPFCEVICHYCHFYTARAKEAPYPDFFLALEQELAREEGKLAGTLEAIYFGGGTPGASPPALLAKLLARLAPRISSSTEITLEANPGSITPALVREWKQAGINRISLGVQSLDDVLLKKLGRTHSARDALAATSACLAEISNVSCDLMYAVPGQSEAAPGEQAEALAALGVPHISAYHLTLEENHFLYSQLPPDDFAWKQIAGIRNRLTPRGFHHYEVASFARGSAESKNNKNYWAGGPYVALGPSAHGFDGESTRWRNISDWREYISRVNAGASPVSATENLSKEQRRLEVIFTSLRTSEGLDLTAFAQSFGQRLEQSHGAWLERWQKEGLAHLANGRLVLTFEGRMLIDEIAKVLI